MKPLHQPSRTPPSWPLIGWAVLCSYGAAGWLHTVSARPQAGWIIFAILAWGIPVALGVRGDLSWKSILTLAVVTRLPHLGATPHLSDDLFRYLFEGLALNHGHNPFLEAPATLTALNPGLAAQVNHPDIPSIYPPIAQLWFRLLALFGTQAIVAQTATMAVDAVNVVLLCKISRSRLGATWPALLYALHPLPVLESAHGAHLEPLAMAACLAVVYTVARHPRWATFFAGLGFGIKLLPIFFVPSLIRRRGWREFAVVGTAAMLLIGLAAWPVLGAGRELGSAFGTYTGAWAFNGLAFPLLQPLLTGMTRPVLGVVGLGVALHACTYDSPARAWREVGAAFLMLSPTVHPWYLLWAFTPALVLGGRAWPLAAVFLQCSYGILLTLDSEGAWHEPWWLSVVTWGPALLVLIAYARRDWRPTAA